MEKRKLLCEGRTKCLYATDREDYLIQKFKDEVPNTREENRTAIAGKGEINNGIAGFLFRYLESHHVPTHFIEHYGPAEMIVRKLTMIPLEVVLHNMATAKLAKTFALAEGTTLTYPILEYYLKNNALGSPMVNEYHALALGYAQPEEMRTISRLASKANAILKSFFDRRGFALMSFHIEFGKQGEQIYIGDEISLDTCCFWDKRVNRRLDMDRKGHDPAEIVESYREVYSRLTNSF
ncbi:MAG: phosphoribosylaminoimidazolesuccinocarboxamide synthase [bacterium]